MGLCPSAALWVSLAVCRVPASESVRLCLSIEIFLGSVFGSICILCGAS